MTHMTRCEGCFQMVPTEFTTSLYGKKACEQCFDSADEVGVGQFDSSDLADYEREMK